MEFHWGSTIKSAKRRREAQKLKPDFERMEGRVLLSQVSTAHPALESRRALVAERVKQAGERNRAYAAEHSTDPETFSRGVDLTRDTVDTGKKLATSDAVLHTGARYAKTSLSHDTTKVAWEYVKAAVRGDGKTLRSLGDTKLVKKVGHDFSTLSHSSAVKRIGDGFSHFGKAVAKGFNRIF